MYTYNNTTWMEAYKLLQPDQTLIVVGQQGVQQIPSFLSTTPASQRLCVDEGSLLNDSFEAVQQIIEWLASCHATRSSLLFVLGSTQLISLVGFVAAIYKRGIKWGFAHTWQQNEELKNLHSVGVKNENDNGFLLECKHLPACIYTDEEELIMPIEQPTNSPIYKMQRPQTASQVAFAEAIGTQPLHTFIILDECLQLHHPTLIHQICEAVPKENIIALKGGEEAKSWQNLWHVASRVQACNRDADNCKFVAIGGGSILDFAGMLAALYKQGKPICYVPTTLLAMVDAALGGKTAINSEQAKNILGIFKEPQSIITEPLFLNSLPQRELFSGYCEVVKYGLLHSEDFFNDIMACDPYQNTPQRSDIIQKCIQIKADFVEEDPKDNGVRRYLNLGHTIGHALEAFSLAHYGQEHPSALLHGEAVMFGMIMELYLSHKRYAFPLSFIRTLSYFAKEHLSPFAFNCKVYKELIRYMYNDKKNLDKNISIVGLKEPGAPIIFKTNEQAIADAFDFYRETFGQ